MTGQGSRKRRDALRRDALRSILAGAIKANKAGKPLLAQKPKAPKAKRLSIQPNQRSHLHLTTLPVREAPVLDRDSNHVVVRITRAHYESSGRLLAVVDLSGSNGTHLQMVDCAEIKTVIMSAMRASDSKELAAWVEENTWEEIQKFVIVKLGQSEMATWAKVDQQVWEGFLEGNGNDEAGLGGDMEVAIRIKVVHGQTLMVEI